MASRKELIQTFLLVVLYGVIFHALQFVFFQREMVSVLPGEDVLSIWDAGFYKDIAEKGYVWKETANNTAFFMLFPMVWKILHVGVWGISFVNLLFFATGFTILSGLYKMSLTDKLILLVIPSNYFCFIPYSEALFFMLASIMVLAIVKKNRYLLWASLFFISLVRPVSMVFIPAFLTNELITNERKAWLRSIGGFLLNYALPLVAGMVFFLWFQHTQTGVWLDLYKEEKHWGHEFKWPTLPFSSMYGPKLLWLNAIAMFVGFVSLLVLIVKGVQWLFRNKATNDKVLSLAYLYCTAMLLETILFNPVWGTLSTNVYDIHRYLFVTPMFFIFILHYTRRLYTAKDYILIFVLSNIFWLLFASYDHIQNWLYYNFNTAVILLYMAYANKKLTWPIIVITAICFYVQVNLLQFFMQSIFPG